MMKQLGRIAQLGALLILTQAVIGLPGSSLWAASSFKLGVVDPQAVLERSKAGKRALAGMKQYAKARQTILTADEEELKQLEQELKDASSLSEQDRLKKQERFRQKVQSYQQRVQEFNQELGVKQKQLVDEYMKKISAATKVVAQKRGLALVMDKGSESTIKIVIYNRKSIDVTDQVVREFDRRYK